ncbi:ATP-binding SpoIIE family protein phosphatase [Streptomyces sp. TRM70308]|uniref:ATP-binding SpoIIE family protein phosphatase n=1 Tax=Streptomyces sp. TRM70308 TaxID=3131932 RepID=UPI003D022AEB
MCTGRAAGITAGSALRPAPGGEAVVIERRSADGRRRLPGPARVSAAVRRSREALGQLLAPRDRLSWLNEASTRIGTTLDLERTSQELADFCVPDLADAAAVDLLDCILRGEDAPCWRKGELPVTRAIAVSEMPGLNLEPDPVGDLSFHRSASLPSRCLIERKPVLVTRIGAREHDVIAPTRNGADAMRRAGVHSYMAVPLIARGVLLGIADFIRVGGRPGFNRTDVALAVELASKAAVYVDNARLYGRERQAVVSLQRSLLPRGTPTTPGLAVDTCYAPAADPGGVGGDWFDVVGLPGGRTALVVGDVMSHGLAAAATMGRLRAVARTLMALDIAPERVLARMDLAARDLEEDQVATCLVAVHDPMHGSYTLAAAGQPPPLVVDAAGQARYVELPVGAPLGSGVIPYDAVEVKAAEGDRLVLYTDGLMKSRSGDVDTALARLRTAAAGLDGTGLDGAGLNADALVDAVSAGGQRFDEAVAIVSAAHPGAGDVLLEQWGLPSDGSAAARARRLVREQLARWGLEELSETTELVVSELVGNALRYGGGPGTLRMLRHGRLVVEVSDTGPDLPQIQHVSLSDEGGRGLQLVNLLCRRWGSCRTPTGKIVWAEQDIAGLVGAAHPADPALPHGAG